MRPLKVAASIAILAWAALTLAAEPRTLTLVGVALLAGAAAIATIVGVLLTNRWVLGVGGVLVLATLIFVAPTGPLALAMAFAAVLAFDAVSEESHLARYRDRLPAATLDHAVSAHARNLVAPLVTLAVLLVVVGVAPLAWAQVLGAGVAEALETRGAIALVVPGLVVLLLPLVVGLLRQRA